MIKFFLIALLFVLLSCRSQNTNQIGPYHSSCDNCIIEKANSVDSYSGKIRYADSVIQFDYGYFSPDILETESEYLDHRDWLFYAESYYYAKNRLQIKNNFHLSVYKVIRNNDSNKVNINADYIALCTFNSDTIKWPINIPDRIKKHIIIIDTCNNFRRKIIYPADSAKGIVGTSITKLTVSGNAPSLSLYSKVNESHAFRKLYDFIEINFNCDSLKRLYNDKFKH